MRKNDIQVPDSDVRRSFQGTPCFTQERIAFDAGYREGYMNATAASRKAGKVGPMNPLPALRIFKKLIGIDFETLLRSDGSLNATTENCFLLDTILCFAVARGRIDSLPELHLELSRCGIYISHPDLKLAVKFLEIEGHLTSNQIKY